MAADGNLTGLQSDSRSPLKKNLLGGSLKLLRGVLRLYWSFRRPLTMGVVGLILDAEHRVLLVEHSYNENFRFPGGGIKKGESSCSSLKRELWEELGIICEPRPENFLGVFYNPAEGKHDHVVLMLITEWQRDAEKQISYEIKHWGFFDPAKLPENTSNGVRRRLAEFFHGSPADPGWQ